MFSHVVGCGCCGLPHILGTIVNSLESHFGHDRAKNDSEFIFLVLSCIRWLFACVQWLVFGLRREQGWGLSFA